MDDDKDFITQKFYFWIKRVKGKSDAIAADIHGYGLTATFLFHPHKAVFLKPCRSCWINTGDEASDDFLRGFIKGNSEIYNGITLVSKHKYFDKVFTIPTFIPPRIEFKNKPFKTVKMWYIESDDVGNLIRIPTPEYLKRI